MSSRDTKIKRTLLESGIGFLVAITSCLLGIRKSNEHCSKVVSGCWRKNTRKTRVTDTHVCTITWSLGLYEHQARKPFPMSLLFQNNSSPCQRLFTKLLFSTTAARKKLFPKRRFKQPTKALNITDASINIPFNLTEILKPRLPSQILFVSYQQLLTTHAQ